MLPLIIFVPCFLKVWACIESRVSSIYNLQLLAPFTPQEFKSAIMQMHLDKAPGPDGSYNPAFFQKLWDVIVTGSNVFASCVNWLDNIEFAASLNVTNLVLIPKCDKPRPMQELRPIALFNVVYKIIAKVFTNRLKIVISKFRPCLVRRIKQD